MKKQAIILGILLFVILAIPTLFLFNNTDITGRLIEDSNDFYSFTKAVCDENNKCQDYEVHCNGNETLEITPITGSIVQFSEDWEDSRTQEQIDKLCD